MRNELRYWRFRVGYFLCGFRWNVLRAKWPFTIYANREIDRLLDD